MIKAIIVDDEKKARDGIKLLLKEDHSIHLIGEAANGKEAIHLINSSEPDLVFLDIQMPGINGFEVLKSLTIKFPLVIFCTAYDQYALRAFDMQALDYLLKPVKKERFFKTLSRAKEFLNNKEESSQFESRLTELLHKYVAPKEDDIVVDEPGGDSLIFKADGKIHFLKWEQVYWVQSLDSYVKIHTENQTFIAKISLKELIYNHPQHLVQVHKSHLVNLSQVDFLEPLTNGDFYLHLLNGAEVKGSRNYRNNLPKIL